MQTVIDVEHLETALAYKLLTAGVQPRPIAWISSVSGAGVANLAPFSFYTVASREPATIAFSLSSRGDGSTKDTLSNIREVGDFVVNVASDEHRAAVDVSSHEHAPDVDEVAVAGLHALPSSRVTSPRLAEARLALECVLDREVAVGTDVLVLGRVVAAWASDGVLDERYRVDNDVLQPLGRLAGPWFTAPLSAVAQETARV